MTTLFSLDRPDWHSQESAGSCSDLSYCKFVWSQPSWWLRFALARPQTSTRRQTDASSFQKRDFGLKSERYLPFVRVPLDPSYFPALVRSEQGSLRMPTFRSWLASGCPARSLSSSWWAGLSQHLRLPSRFRLYQLCQNELPKLPKKRLTGTGRRLQASTLFFCNQLKNHWSIRLGFLRQ